MMYVTRVCVAETVPVPEEESTLVGILINAATPVAALVRIFDILLARVTVPVPAAASTLVVPLTRDVVPVPEVYRARVFSHALTRDAVPVPAEVRILVGIFR
jgi:hypothetical protein